MTSAATRPSPDRARICVDFATFREEDQVRRLLFALATTVSTTLAHLSATAPLIGGAETGTSQFTNVGAFGVVINGTFVELAPERSWRRTLC